MNRSTALSTLAVNLLLVSCTAYQQPPSNNIARAFEQPVKKHPVPSDVIAEALIPDFNKTLNPAPGYLPKKNLLNISVHEVPAREFFMGLVVDTDENMVVHPEVQGTISLDLKKVTLAQVLDTVQKIYGYDYKKNDMGYIIYPATLQTKTFKINRLDLLRLGRSNTQVTSGQINNNNTNNSSNVAPSGNVTPQADINRNQTGTQGITRTSGSTLTTTSDTDFWDELDISLKSIISVDKDATVVINKQSGVVVARAKPMQLREIENFLTSTQNQIGRQVTLEAKILEVILDDAHQAGINWENIVRKGVESAPFMTGLGTFSALNSQIFTLGASAGDFRAFVQLLETQGKTNILSSPRISTLNNQKAIIKVGKDEYFITRVSTNIIASATNSTVTPNVDLTPFFSGIALDVTPQISDNQDITLHIHPSIIRVENQEKIFTLEKEYKVPTALSTVRESDSIVKAKNGQIIVLGGLMQDSLKDEKEGVAGLTQIPYLGNLFRVNKSTKQKSELIILLKPTIIAEDSDWDEPIGVSRERFEQLDRAPRWR